MRRRPAVAVSPAGPLPAGRSRRRRGRRPPPAHRCATRPASTSRRRQPPPVRLRAPTHAVPHSSTRAPYRTSPVPRRPALRPRSATSASSRSHVHTTTCAASRTRAVTTGCAAISRQLAASAAAAARSCSRPRRRAEAEAGAGVVAVGAEQPFGGTAARRRERQVAGAQHVEQLELAQLVGPGPDPFQLVPQPPAAVAGRRRGLQQRVEPGQHGPAAQRVGAADEPRPISSCSSASPLCRTSAPASSAWVRPPPRTARSRTARRAAERAEPARAARRGLSSRGTRPRRGRAARAGAVRPRRTAAVLATHCRSRRCSSSPRRAAATAVAGATGTTA